MTKRKKIALVLVNSALLVSLCVCLWQCRGYETALTSQQAAQNWAGESTQRFAQVSCFFPAGASVTPETINAFRRTIDGKLSEAGLEKKNEGSYWTDAYAAITSLAVSSEHADSETTAVAVGGSFFSFHPYRLLSGSYIGEDDLMKDRVVIDHELAWKLFGGTQLVGQSIKIGGKPFYVAGVIERESDKFTQRALNGQKSDAGDAKDSAAPPLIFLSYSAYANLGGGSGKITPPAAAGSGGASSGAKSATSANSPSSAGIQTSAVPAAASADTSGSAAGSAAISCYEIVLPDPISKFAANLVAGGFKAQQPVVVENSTRYRFSSVWAMFETPGARSVISTPVVFPYWENAARVSEDYVARSYVLIGLLAVFPLVCLLWLTVLFIRRLSVKVKRLCFNIWDAWDDRYGRRQAREQRKAVREAVIEAVESGELPPGELPAPETAEEKFKAFFGKTKREAARAEEKTRALLRRPAKKHRLPKAPRHSKNGRKQRAQAQARESAASLLSAYEQMDIERIVQEVLDEEEKERK